MNRLNFLFAVIVLLSFSVSNAEEKTKDQEVMQKQEVIKKQEINKDSVPVGTGIGQLPSEDEVTRVGNSSQMAEYMPLDKGNVWTYTFKNGDQEKEHTQSVVSVSDGWSVFDNYFGLDGILLRIAPGGELLVTNKGRTAPFYNDGVVTSYPDVAKTPGGNYKQAMVVTIPSNDRFWFQDVYVKGVGLVFHEHITPKGTFSYTLKKADVRGKPYPPK